MIRSESIDSFNYIKDLIDPGKRVVIFHQILRLNVMTFSFVLYCALMLFQVVCIQAFGASSSTLYLIGMYNQWVIANSGLIAALLFSLKPVKSAFIDRRWSLSSSTDDDEFQLLEDPKEPMDSKA